MSEVISYISAHWVQWVFTALLAVLGWNDVATELYQKMLRMQEEKDD